MDVSFRVIPLALSSFDFAPARHWLLRRLIAIVLCLVSGMMSFIIIEQGRTINFQRQLIHQLFQDSLALNAARMKLAQKNR